MTKAEKIEALRLKLKLQAESEEWEENMIDAIVLVSKETNNSIDEIMQWTITRLLRVSESLARIYKSATSDVERQNTLGGF